MADRQFTETEVIALLRRATEYQAAATPSAVDGLSEDQVRSMAIELGISEQAIEMALRTGPEAAPTNWFDRYLGVPIATQIDRTVPGEVNGEQWAEAVHEFRNRLGVTGQIGTVGNNFEWSSGDRELLSATISAGSKNGRTRIRATADGWGAFFLATLAIGMAGVMAAISVANLLRGSSAIQWVGVALALGVAAGLHHRIVSGMMRRRHGALRECVDSFEKALSEGHAGASEIPTPVEAAGVEEEQGVATKA